MLEEQRDPPDSGQWLIVEIRQSGIELEIVEMAIMLVKMEARGAALESMLDPDTVDPRAALVQFGNAYLDLIMSHETLAIARSCIAESEHAMEARMHDDGQKEAQA